MCLVSQMWVIILYVVAPSGLRQSTQDAVIGKQSQIRFKSSFDLVN